MTAPAPPTRPNPSRRFPPGRTEPEQRMSPPSWGLLALAIVVFCFGVAVGYIDRDDSSPSPATAATTTTSLAPYCDTSSGWMVYPGTGIMAGHPDCPSPPPRHEPPGTGPTTINGEVPADD